MNLEQIILLNTSTSIKEAVKEFISDYPFFAYRLIFIYLLIVIIVVSIAYFKYKTYIYMATDVDSVTGLVNWERFKQEATKLIKANLDTKYVLINFDIDRFKTINDMHGTTGGNDVLRSIAVESKALLNEGEMVTRIYADVFSVLLKYKSDEIVIERIEKFVKRINMCYDVMNMNVYFGIYRIDEDIPIEIMSDRANYARKSIKGKGVEYYAFFDKALRERILRVKNIENTMRSSMEAGEFVPYLQPQYSVRTGRIISAEALVRWNDPMNGVVPPGEFIEVFEKNGFIIELDIYMWKQVCKLLRKWIDTGKEPIPISINVSPVHFTNGNLVEEITEIVNEYKIPIELLELEITESTFSEDTESAIETIETLHQMGYRIAMDDFGSGYSSLNLLNILPMDVLKIDRGFLKNTAVSQKGQILIKNIIDMAKDLNMTVIAEGIETRSQYEFLVSTECDKLQGYYYSKPLPVIDFENRYY